MKFVIILSLIGLVTFIVYWRLRPYIRAARSMLKFVRDVRGVNAPDTSSKSARSSGEMLTRCAACGTWVPSARALTLKSSSFCSTDCMERSGTAQPRARKSANL